MPDHLLYLAIDAGVLLVPLLFSFHPRLRFYRQWRAFLIACVLVAVPFLVWDVKFTASGIWGFNPRYLTGVGLFGLPIEEWLFFLCIPYACVFVHHAFGKMHCRGGFRVVCLLLGLLGAILLIMAVIWHDQAYTFLTFLLGGLTLVFLSFYVRPVWLPRAVLAYLAIMPFFFLSNGLLTGSWISEEVVWYNDAENLGIRIGTIPVEDAMYGFLLILLNIWLFEQFRIRRWSRGTTHRK